MSVCTFFGHRDTPPGIESRLRSVIEDLIFNKNVFQFYVGNQGSFDRMVLCILRELKKVYPKTFSYCVVLAYLPWGTAWPDDQEFKDTMPAPDIEYVHPKYAITYRNNWMLDEAKYVVTYVTRSYGGAARFEKRAKKKGKTIIPLASYNEQEKAALKEGRTP